METRLKMTTGNSMETLGNPNLQLIEIITFLWFPIWKLIQKVSSGFHTPFRGWKLETFDFGNFIPGV